MLLLLISALHSQNKGTKCRQNENKKKIQLAPNGKNEKREKMKEKLRLNLENENG